MQVVAKYFRIENKIFKMILPLAFFSKISLNLRVFFVMTKKFPKLLVKTKNLEI